MQTPNWVKLYQQGRVKEIGVPWSKEEQEALRDGYTADQVRNGILDEKSRKKVDKTLTPLDKMLRADLMALAKEKGIVFDEDYVTKAVLIEEIKKLNKKD